MSWTAFKKRLRPGTELRIENYRQPWRSRYVEIVTKNNKHLVVRDLDGDGLASVKLPPAAFTRNVDEDSFEVLAQEDGPQWDANQNRRSTDLLAGMPTMLIRVTKDI